MDDGFVGLVFIAWIIGTIIAAVIASNRKVSTGLVVLLSVFFSPVIGVLVACLMTPKAGQASANAASPVAAAVPEKKCPKCAEMVKKEAVICRFCGYDFAPDIAAAETARLAAEEAKGAAEEAKKAAWEADAPKRAAEAKTPAKSEKIVGFVVGGGVLLLLVVTLTFSNRGTSHTTPNTSPASTSAASTSTTTAYSPWTVRTETNAVNGASTLYAESGYGNRGMVIRQTGKKLELFINTDEFLETTDNMDSRAVGITYRIDDGKPVHQYWSLSSDNTALFYPGNPAALIEKLRSAKTFHFQYPPSGKIPEVISIDVEQFPKEIQAGSAKTATNKHHAADRQEPDSTG